LGAPSVVLRRTGGTKKKGNSVLARKRKNGKKKWCLKNREINYLEARNDDWIRRERGKGGEGMTRFAERYMSINLFGLGRRTGRKKQKLVSRKTQHEEGGGQFFARASTAVKKCMGPDKMEHDTKSGLKKEKRRLS